MCLQSCVSHGITDRVQRRITAYLYVMLTHSSDHQDHGCSSPSPNSEGSRGSSVMGSNSRVIMTSVDWPTGEGGNNSQPKTCNDEFTSGNINHICIFCPVSTLRCAPYEILPRDYPL